MKGNEESGGTPAEASSKDGPKNDVIEVFDVKVMCITSANGTKSCKIQEISVDVPNKNAAPEVLVAPTLKDASVTAVPSAAPINAAPRELAAGNDAECSLCQALADALREQVTAAGPSTMAPRQLVPRDQRARRRAV